MLWILRRVSIMAINKCYTYHCLFLQHLSHSQHLTITEFTSCSSKASHTWPKFWLMPVELAEIQAVGSSIGTTKLKKVDKKHK